MLFKLAVVGHKESLKEIQNIIYSKFNNIEPVVVEFNDDDESESAYNNLVKIMPLCDAILYTRFEPYKIMASMLEHTVPVRYVDVDSSNLIHCLLKAAYHYKADIRNISIDTLDREAVMSAFTSIGIDESEVKAHIINIDSGDKHFVHKIDTEHRYNYNKNLCDFCITNIRSIYVKMIQENIKCVLLAPSKETYIYEIRRLMISHGLNKLNDNHNVIIKLKLYPKSDFYIYNKTLLQEVMDLNKAREYAAIFSENVRGVIISASEMEFYILCKSALLESETENFTKLDLLQSIAAHTALTVNIAIGYGNNLKKAKANAETGLKHSNPNSNQAYVVYDAENIVGPIEPNEIISIYEELIDERLIQISELSGLSINTIYKIDTYVKQKRNSPVTSKELSIHLGISTRTADRIVSRLEKCGLIIEAGRQVIKERGRPTRILKIMF